MTVACALTLSACGGSKDEGTIPADRGQALINKLDSVQSLVDEGRCDEAEAAAVEVAGSIGTLPIEGDLQQALVAASDNLIKQTQDDSQCTTPDVGPSGETGAATEPTDPATQEPPPADTAEAPTDPETTPPEDPGTDAPGNSENSNGNGGGNGNANGQHDVSGGIATGG